MPRCGWLALILCLPWTLTGCLWTEQTESTSWMKRFRERAISPEHALIEVALIERPIGDDYINQRIWEQTDEFFERRSALEENGLRVGQLVGTPPSFFQQMLTSKRCCSNPQALIFPAGHTKSIWFGPTLGTTLFDIVQGNNRTEVLLDQARFGLDVTAKFAKDGRTTLTFTPKVENGEHLLPFKAVPERSTWELRIEKAAQKYPDLGWEVTLGANQYLVVGARIDHPRTLGVAALTQLDGSLGVQRLLVIRNCRSVTAHEAHETAAMDLIRADKTPPLALQATLPATRAKTN